MGTVRRNDPNVKLPKEGTKIKTTQSICAACQYSVYDQYLFKWICVYILKTNKPRGCKKGECNKFRENTFKRKPRAIAKNS